ncbi:hypothetical protein EST38_g10561 [Candolleomyces aberdarensis]|uniref:Uncharacterized protein n=1 Tax=Candolleomyces aberdarensis TaxID=2316362 RepID=A0A4Q2D726_9AGAR|nr:hypothetical protein EST38_g10561 [Candolleomyces aberdarensis]
MASPEPSTANDWPTTGDDSTETQAPKRTFDEVHSPSKKTRTPKKKKGNITTLSFGRLPIGTPVLDPDTPTRPRNGKATPFPSAIEPLNLEATKHTKNGEGGLSSAPSIPASTWDPVPANVGREDLSSLTGGMEGVTITQASDTNPASSFLATAAALTGDYGGGVAGATQGHNTHDDDPDPFQQNPNPTAGILPPPNLSAFTNVAVANFPKVHFHRFMFKASQEPGTIESVLRGATPPLVLAWRFLDTRGNDDDVSVPQRSDMVAIFRGLGVNNVRAYPAKGWKAGPNPLGKTKGTQPVIFVNSRIPHDVHATVTRVRYFNTPTYTYTFLDWNQGSSDYAFMLENLAAIEASDGNIQDITEAVRDAIRNSTEARQCLDAFHDTVRFEKKGVTYNQESYLEALLKTVKAIGTQADTRGKTEWSVHWKCPTDDENGEHLWVTTLRNIPITTPFGVVNRKQAPVVWCNICHFNCHTAAFCPFPSVPGWKMPSTPGNSTGGGGNGLSRGGRGGGRGLRVRGRGRGN